MTDEAASRSGARRSDLIVSVHIPKTAGTSFKNALSAVLGTQRLVLDYHHAEDFEVLAKSGVKPLMLHRQWLCTGKYPVWIEYGAAVGLLPMAATCIHGHFPASKYLLLKKARNLVYITWLRDPLDRMLSNYFYWMEQPDEIQDTLVQKIKREQWSPEKMCFAREFRNYQSLWLSGVPARKFSFIGIVEEYERCLGILSAKLRLNLPYSVVNTTKSRAASSEYQYLLRDFKRYHKKDYELYEYAKSRLPD